MAMERWRADNALVRLVAIVVVACSLAGAIVPLAVAQDEPLPAAIVAGECGNPGDVVADLNPLAAREGGVLASFTTVDVAADELTNGGYAVVVGDRDAPASCGEIAGEGDDVYVAVRGQNDSGLGGVAWLHARGDRTQVSLFVGEGLGGAPSAVPTVEPDGPPEPPDEETPEPPAEETPETEPTAAPSGNLVTYTSPSYGFTLAYDSAFWRVEDDRTEPRANGPLDYLTLNHHGVAQAELFGMAVDGPVTALRFVHRFLPAAEDDPKVTEVTVRTDVDGDPIRGGGDAHAFVAVDVTRTDDTGASVTVTYHVEAWKLPEAEAFVLLIFQTARSDYEEWTPAREALVQGLEIPE